MALKIETFDNKTGGQCYFKALGHPMSAGLARDLARQLTDATDIAIYDPLGQIEPFDALYSLDEATVSGVYVQNIEHLGREVMGKTTRPITDLPSSKADIVFIPAFDATRLVDQIAHLIPAGASVVTLDEIRLDPGFLTNKRHYLDPLNFATNFAFFREGAGHHTRVVTANYWGGYGAKGTFMWLCLFDGDGNQIAEWQEELGPANSSVVIDSKEVASRLNLPEFCGQLFIHVINGAGHDVVKYALDTYGDNADTLSCTHDANAWPSDLYAGLPAPEDGEKVVLWIQNSHPEAIPAGAIGLNRMGQDKVEWLDKPVPGFGSYALDVRDLLPGLEWPEQIEIRAGKHFVRPRYEITKKNNRLRISHPNVERVDLKPDPKLADIANLMGKGFVLPAPVLPGGGYRSELLPTPMSTAQKNLPITALVYNSDGQEIARHRFGCLSRDHSELLDLGALAGGALGEIPGHCELIYDFLDGGEADGWLHGLFRYTDLKTGHAAETSFGAHMFNHVLTYKGEPHSYAGPAPGLSTRLFLRTAPEPIDAFCHLIYPVSSQWHQTSQTKLMLHNANGDLVAERDVKIPASGSHYFTLRTTFTEDECKEAGPYCYVLIRDVTCRLFGYHGLIRQGESFSLDHMFGF